MDLNIRKAVMENISSASNSSLREIIDDAIQSQVETTLPGLGVMFEVLWKNSVNQEKDQILNKLSSSLKH